MDCTESFPGTELDGFLEIKTTTSGALSILVISSLKYMKMIGREVQGCGVGVDREDSALWFPSALTGQLLLRGSASKTAAWFWRGSEGGCVGHADDADSVWPEN